MTQFKLEVVVIPVSNVDRAKSFYESLGWRLDADFSTGPDFRVVQVTPTGSPTSIIFGTGVTTGHGPVDGLHLVVPDVEIARAELAAAGVEVSEVFHDADGVFHHGGAEGRVSGPDPERKSYASFASFSDPDGNGWWLQEITTRLPGRVDPASTSFGSVSDVADALRRAAAAHGEHEQLTGEEDPDWHGWYAEYIVAEQAGTQPPT
jgi:catechol 2,3-dioxygenase-like lactoylglutathione lyase family enzyme